jgi:hypothetical protein
MNLRHFGIFGGVAAVFLACGDDPANDASPGGGADAGSSGDAAKEPNAPDGGGSSDGSPPDGSSSSDAGQDGSICVVVDAGGAGGGADDQPFACTPHVAAQGNPPYVLGGARAPYQGGVVQPGLYRATKATHTYVEDAPGDCDGKTPPPATVYAAEMEIRPTHFLMRSAGITITGSWTACGNQFIATIECPSVTKASGFGYTSIGNTFLRDSGKTSYVDGGCRFGLEYEFVKQ